MAFAGVDLARIERERRRQAGQRAGAVEQRSKIGRQRHRIDRAAVEQRGPQEAGLIGHRIGRRIEGERIRGQERLAQRRARGAQRVQAGLPAQARMRAPHRLGLDARFDRRALRVERLPWLLRVGARAKRIDRRAAHGERDPQRRAGILALELVELPLARQHPQRIRERRLRPASMPMVVGCVSSRVAPVMDGFFVTTSVSVADALLNSIFID